MYFLGSAEGGKEINVVVVNVFSPSFCVHNIIIIIHFMMCCIKIIIVCMYGSSA